MNHFQFDAREVPTEFALYRDAGVLLNVPAGGPPTFIDSPYNRGIDAGEWSREGTTATSLGSRVLLVGGLATDRLPEDSDPLIASQATAKTGVVDSETLAFTPTGQPKRYRWEHSAARLDGDSVAVFGGRDVTQWVKAVEVWDAATGRFHDAGSLRYGRVGHTTTALPDGSVLVVGGCRAFVSYGTHFNERPSRGAFTSEHWKPSGVAYESPLLADRCGHAAALLHDGRVLVAGGLSGEAMLNDQIADPPGGSVARASAELWDPKTGKWTKAADMHERHGNASAVTLGDGRVLVVSAPLPTSAAEPNLMPSMETYDPKTDTWTTIGPPPASFPSQPRLALLGPDRVLLVAWDVVLELTIAPAR